MKVGARNNLEGEVTEIKKGRIMCQVKVKLAGGDHTMSSVMTVESLDDLGIQEGSKVKLVVKAVNVLITEP